MFGICTSPARILAASTAFAGRTVLIDGVPARSCITAAAACENAEVRTIESFDDDEIMKELRAAFSREHALQCGYCTPGMLMARDLVVRAVDADEQAIRVAMSAICAGAPVTSELCAPFRA